MEYNILRSPHQIGNMTIKNRVIMTAAGCEMATTDGEITEAYLAYYEARAKGGVGAIITELMQVDPDTGVMNHNQVKAWSDASIPELKKLADRIHQYDCRVIVQLQHPGNMTHSGNLQGRTPVSASAQSNLIYDQPVREMTIEEIQRLITRFADSIYHAKQAGIDGVEIHAAHFYLLHQFLTPFFNHRQDDYGGSFENRLRILRDILRAAREKVGSDYPILVRVSVEEYLPEGGYHLNEGIRICRAVEEAGASAINVTCAGSGCKYGQSLEPASFRQGWRKHLSKAVKQFVSIPVIGVATVRDPDYAEKLLQDGYMDFVGSARNHIADPQWTNKAFSGKRADIRKCISCLKCIQGVVQGEGIQCSVNPLCGREGMSAPERVTDNKSVVVLGGGPAGMQAAITASQRGFRVTLYERSDALGGQLRLAGAAPHKEAIRDFIAYLTGELRKNEVCTVLKHAPTLDELKELSPYAIIDATGAVPLVPKVFAGHEGFVVTPDKILDGRLCFNDMNIVIVGSGMTGLETAEYLIQSNNMITIIEMNDKIAPAAYGSQVRDITKYLDIANTVIMTSTALNTIENGYITVKDVPTGEISSIPADVVILSLGVRPECAYGDALKSVATHVIAVGDAVKSGRIVDAVTAGSDAGNAIAL